MPHPLIDHIRRMVELAPEEEAEILSFFEPVTARKKYILARAGETSPDLYFVAEGCIRLFHLSERGAEQTIQFAIEGWWLTDFSAFPTQQCSEFTIQALEKSELLAISAARHELLLARFPQLERYFRLIYQRAYGASQVRLKYQHDLSREEMYRRFASSYPQFTQRIPQYLLASFLGFTPEYLSELRKKRS
ncbi:Crp/Fnr family transcriptional regulator [Dyadobacter sandarakinus]|uniref:Crp/Fnr family transcriptional regulator n=1 Tax=Dyadobacter sandarakinus TaxID=2747268 RepID=A0ABX7I540_9BACT|nr:Crp/Fnr family transcriptional regulator [Dyadobacter sandarakinus]QRR00990.1 Crp/Fnr family transcriptional regulator [Dyadobacter sandarakinus]